MAIENLTGSENFGDTLTGDANINLIDGRGGDDVIEGGGGNDVLDGGVGTDGELQGRRVLRLCRSLGGRCRVRCRRRHPRRLREPTGSASWGDQLIGDGGNEINGLGGDDTIVGLGGADMLTGGAGADIFMYNASVTPTTTSPCSSRSRTSSAAATT